MCVSVWGAILLGLGAIVLAALAFIGAVYLLVFSCWDREW